MSALNGLGGWGGGGGDQPLLSIKGSIDRKHECVSAASHPWTADNGPGRPAGEGGGGRG